MSDTQQERVTVDPVKFTRDRLTEIGNVWVDFAKAKVLPYVEKQQQWVKQRREAMATALTKPPATEGAPVDGVPPPG